MRYTNLIEELLKMASADSELRDFMEELVSSGVSPESEEFFHKIEQDPRFYGIDRGKMIL